MADPTQPIERFHASEPIRGSQYVADSVLYEGRFGRMFRNLSEPTVRVSDPHSRATRSAATRSAATWHATRAAVMCAILFLVVTPDVCAAETFSGKATPVRLQLKWRHQFQFAGFYAALEKGYSREAGFDVTIVSATPGTDPVETVLKGGADFGIASSELVLRYAKGDPVVVLASIFQHSALALFVRGDAGIDTVRDLAGHNV